MPLGCRKGPLLIVRVLVVVVVIVCSPNHQKRPDDEDDDEDEEASEFRVSTTKTAFGLPGTAFYGTEAQVLFDTLNEHENV
jgi:hypothetical protein